MDSVSTGGAASIRSCVFEKDDVLVFVGFTWKAHAATEARSAGKLAQTHARRHARTRSRIVARALVYENLRCVLYKQRNHRRG